VKYHFPNSPWYVEAGQFKAPFAHEQLVFDRTLLAADRTLTDDILANGEAFSQGVMTIYDNGGQFAPRRTLPMDYGVNDVNFESYPSVRQLRYWRPRRIQIHRHVEGLRSIHFAGDTQDLMVAGAGLDWTEADPTDTVRQAVDFQWNTASGSVRAYIGRYSAQRIDRRYLRQQRRRPNQLSHDGGHLEFFGDMII